MSIELQSLFFYVMAAMKKDSAFSVDAGLKYFILGAFSSSLFLFGSSILNASFLQVGLEPAIFDVTVRRFNHLKLRFLV